MLFFIILLFYYFIIFLFCYFVVLLTFSSLLKTPTPNKHSIELAASSIVDGLGGVFSVKKDNELAIMLKSAAITTSAYKKFLLNEIETAIDEVRLFFFLFLFFSFLFFFVFFLVLFY